MTSEFSRADLAFALGEYRARLSEAVEFATAWHDKLGSGLIPSAAQTSEFERRAAAMIIRAAQEASCYAAVPPLIGKTLKPQR